MKFVAQTSQYADYPFPLLISTYELKNSWENIQSKYLTGNKHNIIDSKGMTFDAVVCVTKAS